MNIAFKTAGTVASASLQLWLKSAPTNSINKIIKSKDVYPELGKLCQAMPITSVHYRDTDYHYAELDWYKKVFEGMWWNQYTFKWKEEISDCDRFAIFTVAMFEMLGLNAMFRIAGQVKWTEGGVEKTGAHAFNIFCAEDNGVRKWYIYDAMYNFFEELKGEQWTKVASHNISYMPTSIVE